MRPLRCVVLVGDAWTPFVPLVWLAPAETQAEKNHRGCGSVADCTLVYRPVRLGLVGKRYGLRGYDKPQKLNDRMYSRH